LSHSRRQVLVGGLALAACRTDSPSPPAPALQPTGSEPRNVVLILTDDQRYDSLGFLGHPLSQTPHLDAMSRAGAHFTQSFVTTSLCCPSRASMLTGLYAHAHGVLDNTAELDPHFLTYAQLLQGAGMDTAYFGKWHMGAANPHPRPGWSRWAAFRGQGRYVWPGKDRDPLDAGLSFDGEVKPISGYITDVLTDLAVEYLQSRDGKRPFVMVLAHKGVHHPFSPAPRHAQLFADTTAIPAVLPDDDASYAGLPAWLRPLRETTFGAEKPYHWEDFRSWYLDYHRTLASIDESVGRIVATLQDKGLSERTVVLFASDNGFQFGEKGIVDKRNFYEPSIRIPLLAHAPGLVKPGLRVGDFVLGVDLAPTILELCGFRPPAHWHGRSFVPLLQGERPSDWRTEFLYEYFFERAYPHTPTLFGLRAPQHKLALYHGLSEVEELYDLAADPHERVNLALDTAWDERRKEMKARLAKQAQQVGLLTEPIWGSNWLASPEQAAGAEGVAPSKIKTKGKKR
jgi:N-acetylglucosamine-6-sulfatase